MDAFPAVAKYRWTFIAGGGINGSKTGRNDTRRHKAAEEKLVHRGSGADAGSALIYVAEVGRDFGTLRCYAENAMGKSELPCVYHLVPAGKITMTQ